MIATTHINEFPLLAIEPDMQKKLFQAVDNTQASIVSIKYLSIYLHITGFKLQAIHTLKDIETILYGFEGFLIKNTKSPCGKISQIYKKARNALAATYGIAADNSIQLKLKERHSESVKFWEFITKSKNILKYYEGWYSKSRDNNKHFINLTWFYLSYGDKLTDYLLSLIDDVLIRYSYDSCRTRTKHLKRITTLLCKLYPTKEDLQKLQSGKAVNEFVELLFAQWKAEVFIKELSLEAFYKDWAAILITLNEVLIGTAIMGKPLYPLFCPTYKSSPHKDKSKTLFNKALMDIPLTISDDEAFNHFASGIEQDINYVSECCNEERLISLRNHEATIARAKEGTVIDNFNNLKFGQDFTPADVCSTWAKYGYNIKRTGIFKIMTTEAVKKIINPLGAYTLIPFMLLLVQHHPFITPPWLLKFELYDESGRQINYLQSGDDWIAIGYKPRAKGREEQAVKLTAITKQIFDEIIAITRPAREFLKSIGNDSYRNLFLSGGGNFNTPRAIVSMPNFSLPRLKIPLASAILKKAKCALQKKRAARILETLSLRSLRATVAIQTYVKTLSRRAVSMLLRHGEDSKHVLDSYIPTTLTLYLMERWVRLFQNAIIYEAMKDSPYLLASLDFNTQEELDQFLNIHKDNYVITGKSTAKDKNPGLEINSETADRLYIELNLEKLEVLLCIYEMVNSAFQVGAAITRVAERWFGVATLIHQAVHLHRDGLLQGYCSRSVLTLFSKANPNPHLKEKIKRAIYA